MFKTPKEPPSQATTERYRAVSRRLLKDYSSATHTAWDDDHEELIAWMTNLRNRLDIATWRHYRAALVFSLNETNFQDEARAIQDISTDGCTSQGRTSSQKKKSISDKEIIELSNSLIDSARSYPDDQYSIPTLEFILSGIHTGLRPCEWFNAELTSHPHHLSFRVKNAKATQGRAHGEYRHFELSGLSRSEERAITSHWQRCKAFKNQKEYDRFYKACSDRLYRTSKKLWPNRKKRPTLYSCRHQSIANDKTCASLREIAATHGHFSSRTSGEHYGKKRYGNTDRAKKQPDNAEVSRVKVVPQDWRPRRDIEKELEFRASKTLRPIFLA